MKLFHSSTKKKQFWYRKLDLDSKNYTIFVKQKTLIFWGYDGIDILI